MLVSVDVDICIKQSAPDVLLEALAGTHKKAFEVLEQKGWSAVDIRTVLEGQGGLAVIAKQGDDVSGFALFRHVLDEAELITLAVDPACQRKGIARQLLDAGIGYLSKQACTSIFLEVRSDNRPAIILYERHGFIRSGLRKGYYKTEKGIRLDALMFSRRLA